MNNKLEPDFKRKTNRLNNFFTSKCTPLKNEFLPTLLEHEYEARFSKITFTDDQILKILRAIHINKARGHDEISIRMLKLSDDLSLHPYQHCSRIVLIQGLSQTLGRSQIFCPFTKKGTSR